MSNIREEHWSTKTVVEAVSKIYTNIDKEDLELFDELGSLEANKILPYIPKDSIVVDFGGGIGRVARHVAPHVGKVIVVDVSQSMLDLGKNHWCNDIKNIEWKKSIVTIPLPDNSIDVLYSLLCISHIRYETKELELWTKEIRRVVKDDGKFIYDTEKPWHDWKPIGFHKLTRTAKYTQEDKETYDFMSQWVTCLYIAEELEIEVD